MVVGIYMHIFHHIVWPNNNVSCNGQAPPPLSVLCRPQGNAPGEPGNLGILPYVMCNCKTIL